MPNKSRETYPNKPYIKMNMQTSKDSMLNNDQHVLMNSNAQ